MRNVILIPLLIMGWSCGASSDREAIQPGPFVEEVQAMEEFASEVLSLKPPVQVSLSGPCWCGHSWLLVSDSSGTAIKYGYCHYRMGDRTGVEFPVISRLDCHSHSPAGDLEPGSAEELAIQIFAGIWLRSEYAEINSRLAAMNLRQPVGSQGESKVVVRPLGEIVYFPEEIAGLRKLDKVNEEFGNFPDRFWAFRFILCNEA